MHSCQHTASCMLRRPRSNLNIEVYKYTTDTKLSRPSIDNIPESNVPSNYEP